MSKNETQENENHEQENENQNHTNHQAEIEQEYQSTLGRSADSDGLNYFNSLLQSGQMTLAQLHAALESSEEGRHHLAATSNQTAVHHQTEIEREYQSTLGRSADSDGLNYFNSLLQSGQMTLAQLHAALESSEEGRHHLAATSSQTAVNHQAEIEREYQSTLGRSADSDGLNYFNGLLQSGKMTLAQLHMALQTSEEGQHHQIEITGTATHTETV